MQAEAAGITVTEDVDLTAVGLTEEVATPAFLARLTSALNAWIDDAAVVSRLDGYAVRVIQSPWLR